MNSTAIKEAAAVAYPRDKMIGVWWSGAEPDVIPAGDQATGYKALMLQHRAGKFKVHEDIEKFVYRQGQVRAGKETSAQVLYNRGLINSMLGVEAIRTAQKKFGNKPLTGEQVRWGFENLDLTAERIKELGFEGMLKPIKFTCADHEGARPGPRPAVGRQGSGRSSPTGTRPTRRCSEPMVKEASAKYADEKKITPRDCSKAELIASGQMTASNAGGGASRLPPQQPQPEPPNVTDTLAEARARRQGRMPRKPILAVNNIEVIYDHVILVLKGVSLDVPTGGIVALLGANGAGKSTTLKAISNLLQAERGEVTKGSIEFKGERVDGLTPNDLVRRGCIQVMEGRHCFGHLTVEENLLTGAFTRRDGTRGDRSATSRWSTAISRA